MLIRNFILVAYFCFLGHSMSLSGIGNGHERYSKQIGGSQPTPLRRWDRHPSCDDESVRVRKSWVHLSLPERQDYINAVRCLLSKPAVTPKSFAPGVRNRMDDFTASHVNQTLFIHFSGWLLPWHRYFVWQYETALREECGYKGSQPYWDWTEHNDDISQHPLFDGSISSLGGNGLFVPHGIANGTVPGVPDPQVVTRPPGTGGGCVVDGPFANLTLNLGPVFPLGNPNNTGLEYTPHCLTRDFLNDLSQAFLTRERVAELLAQPSLADFRRTLDDAIHFGGHSAVGGDLSDVFTSPQEPAFYFHHSQVDRLWTLWQDQDPATRLYATSDTRTYSNSPPSPNVTISDVLEFGYVGGQVTIADIANTLGGTLCYRYE